MIDLIPDDITRLAFSCTTDGHAYIMRGNEKLVQWLIENKGENQFEILFPEEPLKVSYLCELWSTSELIEFRRRQTAAKDLINKVVEDVLVKEIEGMINPEDEKKQLIAQLKDAIQREDMNECIRISKLRKEKGYV